MTITLHCPCCGAVFSPDVAVADEDARKAIARALDVPGQLGKPLLQYMRLLEPASKRMAWSKFHRLLDELLPQFVGELVERGGHSRPCSHATWAAAMLDVVTRRDRLTLPLTTHGYLLDVAWSMAERAEAQGEREREQHRQHRSHGTTESMGNATAVMHRGNTASAHEAALAWAKDALRLDPANSYARSIIEAAEGVAA